jgi:hypothetical protein
VVQVVELLCSKYQHQVKSKVLWKKKKEKGKKSKELKKENKRKNIRRTK